jgi:hypothetical protein
VSFYRQAYLAITDFNFYPGIFSQSLRRSLTFLLYLAANVAIVLTLIYAALYYPIARDFFSWAEENVPSFYVEDRILTVDADQPYVTKYERGTGWTFVFDTTGTYLDPIGLEEPVFLFTKEKLLFRLEGRTQTYSWEEFGSFQINPDEMEGYRSALFWIYFPFGYSFFFLFTLFAKAAQALLLSLLSFTVATSYGIRLPLRQTFTIALYSLVPATVVDLAVEVTGLNISYFDLIYLAAAGIYTYLATQRCVTGDGKLENHL